MWNKNWNKKIGTKIGTKRPHFYIHTSYVSKMGGEGEEEEEEDVKVIIDTDPGIDDAFAVLASLSCMPNWTSSRSRRRSGT